jgi:hypothetical protein
MSTDQIILLGVITLTVVVMAGSAKAEAQPQPRPSLSPGVSDRSFPSGLRSDVSVGAKSISVTNVGDATLRFSAWDGASSWQSYTLAPNQTLTISCAKCEEVIPISFHDGTETRGVDARMTERHALYWSGPKGRWDFALFSELVRSNALPR